MVKERESDERGREGQQRMRQRDSAGGERERDREREAQVSTGFFSTSFFLFFYLLSIEYKRIINNLLK